MSSRAPQRGGGGGNGGGGGGGGGGRGQSPPSDDDSNTPPPPPQSGGRGSRRDPDYGSPPPQRRSGGPRSSYPPNGDPRDRDFYSGPRDSGGPPGRRRRPTPQKGYDMPREKGPPSRQEILLCRYDSANHTWDTKPIEIDPRRDTDRQVWEHIREVYRMELQKLWRRIFLFTKLKSIIPIEFTRNGVPTDKSKEKSKQEDDKTPITHSFLHAYHHPSHLRTEHQWVDYFMDFKASSPHTSVGLEFKEGLWAEKLAFIAISAIIAMIVVSIVWCLKGGELQTVFTVMGFVLSGFASIVALIALYYQIVLSN